MRADGQPGPHIDIIMGVAGVQFDTAWKERAESSYGGVPIHIMGQTSLIQAKAAAGRPQDLLDLEKLRASDAGKA